MTKLLSNMFTKTRDNTSYQLLPDVPREAANAEMLAGWIHGKELGDLELEGSDSDFERLEYFNKVVQETVRGFHWPVYSKFYSTNIERLMEMQKQNPEQFDKVIVTDTFDKAKKEYEENKSGDQDGSYKKRRKSRRKSSKRKTKKRRRKGRKTRRHRRR